MSWATNRFCSHYSLESSQYCPPCMLELFVCPLMEQGLVS